MSIFAWRVWETYSANSPTPFQNYRVITSIPYELALHGSFGTAWPIGKPLQAHCYTECVWPCEMHTKHTNNDIIPTIKCTCGIYALIAPPDLSTVCIPAGNQAHLGVVEIWGKIFVATDGYRAQYGQLRALVGSPDIVAATYRVPNLPSVEYAQKEYFGASK